MTLNNHIFSFLLILTMTNLFGQSEIATISFETKYLENRQIEFTINGQTILPSNERRIIKIYKTDFDTLTCSYNGKQIGTSVLKFKKNTEYIITINPCSFYDVRPADKPLKGVVRYNYISSKNDSINAILDFYSEKFISDKKTNYYSYIPSAMCFYGKKKIALADSKMEKELSSIYYHFLHGEKLTFVYDIDSKKQSLILDGYINEEETHPIMETIN